MRAALTSPWLIVAFLVALIISGGFGFWLGDKIATADCQARNVAAVDADNKRVAKAGEAADAVQDDAISKLDDLKRKQEGSANAAHESGGAGGVCLDADSVRRLNAQ